MTRGATGVTPGRARHRTGGSGRPGSGLDSNLKRPGARPSESEPLKGLWQQEGKTNRDASREPERGGDQGFRASPTAMTPGSSRDEDSVSLTRGRPWPSPPRVPLTTLYIKRKQTSKLNLR